MPSITQLEYVIAVDTHRHFGRAAKACYVTQPTLSMQLQKLEEELEVVIFDRSKKPLLPTMMGERIIVQARKILSEYKKIKSLVSSDGDLIKGDFTLAMIPTMTPYWLPLFIESFAKKYPALNLRVFEYQTAAIIDLLQKEEIDAGLLATPLNAEGIFEDVIAYEPFYLYVHKSHPFSQKAFIREEELKSEEIWLLEEGHCFRSQVLRLCHLNQKKSVLSNFKFESGSLETLKMFVQRKMGYTLLPYLATNSQKNDVVTVPFKKPIPSREVSLVYARSQLKRPVLQALKAEIFNHLPEEIRNLKKKDLEVLDALA